MSGPVGIVILIHTAFERAEQVIRHWVAGGCPVVVHVDAKVRPQTYDRFVHALSDLTGNGALLQAAPLRMGHLGHRRGQSGRRRDDAGEVSRRSARLPCVRVLPAAAPRCANSSITSRTAPASTSSRVPRPPMSPGSRAALPRSGSSCAFPFSWKRQRFLFDRWVDIQRRFRLQREIPEGLTPHMGSQWWCLTRETMTRILKDPARARYDAYFRLVWIPDESLFPDPRPALFPQYREPVPDAVEVRFPRASRISSMTITCSFCGGRTVSSHARSGPTRTGSTRRFSTQPNRR